VERAINCLKFSLIDVRPTFKMADSCRKHDVKLLTYGSLVRVSRKMNLFQSTNGNSAEACSRTDGLESTLHLCSMRE
jgi:hypothetical protein